MSTTPLSIVGHATVTIEQNFQFMSERGSFAPCTVVAMAVMSGGRLHSPVLVSASFVPPGGQQAIDDWAHRELGLSAMSSLFRKDELVAPPLDRTQRLAILAEVLSFAMGFQRGEEQESCPSYINGLVETSGHIAACCLCQWLDLSDGVGTAETVEALELHKMPELPRLRELLDIYLKELEAHQTVEERPRGRHAEHCAAIQRTPGSCNCTGGNYVASGRGPRQLGAYDG